MQQRLQFSVYFENWSKLIKGKKKKQQMKTINTETYSDLKYYEEKTQQTYYGSKKSLF